MLNSEKNEPSNIIDNNYYIVVTCYDIIVTRKIYCNRNNLWEKKSLILLLLTFRFMFVFYALKSPSVEP